MNYICAAQTDIGIVKETNQDSHCVRVAQSEKYGPILFAAVCDGMGGLSKGELASATVLKEFMYWFEFTLADYLERADVDFNYIKNEWTGMIKQLNEKIGSFGTRNRYNLGTTLVMILGIKDKLYVANVGDSRLYKITDKVYRMTTDHSLVAQEIATGKLRPEDEETDSRRNVLLQCIGASQSVAPEIQEYALEKNAVYILCSDGFRHLISEAELFGLLSPNVVVTEEGLSRTLRDIIELLMSRNERDNITAVAVKTV